MADEQAPEEIEIGRVMDYFARIGVAGIDLTGPLKAGDRIHIKGHTSDFEQVVRVEAAPSGQSSTVSHYVGNVKFDDFSTLEYGTGYQVYCKAGSPVTVSFTG